MSNDTHPYYPCVRLIDDTEFVGYVFGRYVDVQGRETDDVVVSVSKPGKSGLRGCVHLPKNRLEQVG